MFKIAKNVYDEDFKRSIVSLYQNGKTQTQLSKDYGSSLSAINKWANSILRLKLKTEMCLPLNKQKNFKNEILNLEEENQILKKVITIFTPHSNKD